MSNLTAMRDTIETALFGTEGDAAQFEATQAERLRVYAVHHDNELQLRFTPPGAVYGLDRSLDWTDAETLLFDVRTEADQDGGFRYVVYPDGVVLNGRDWKRACDFGPQEAAALFEKAAEYEDRRRSGGCKPCP